jgi:histidine triad (HIT) family protein
MTDENCLFCQIVLGKAPSEKVHEDANFVVIKNKYPQAPVHVLVIDKMHREKPQTMSGDYAQEGYWDKMFATIYDAILLLKLDKTGYKLVNNGAGYNHFEHEHFHIMGGTETEPGGST